MVQNEYLTQGRIAQLVEHWSNKPAVRGSIPRSTSLFVTYPSSKMNPMDMNKGITIHCEDRFFFFA
jgi:hypothetical protein